LLELLKWFVTPLYYDQSLQFRKLVHNIWCKKAHIWRIFFGILSKSKTLKEWPQILWIGIRANERL